MSLLVAVIVELLLFAFHLHGRDPVDVQVHVLLVWSICGCIATISLEQHFPHSVNAAIARYEHEV